jgi:hypothetical protein
MTYKNKRLFLLILIAVLALIYTGSFVFSPERNTARLASYVWLEPRLTGRISRIVINSEEQDIELVKRNQQWFVLHEGNEYPARQLRIEDFLSAFTTRSVWSVRASSASSHARFGLESETANRVTIYGENAVLLDLLLGYSDSTGRDIFVRRYSQDEVRSGDDRISMYYLSPVSSWYNLRFIPESEDGGLDINSVQRLTVYHEGETQIFTRAGRGWDVTGIDIAVPDMSAIESYIRIVLNSEGDNFIDSVSPDDPALNYSRLVFELGNGRIITIRVSGPDEVNRRIAHVSGSDYIYGIPLWVTVRLFRNAEFFERQ